jgi:serine protease
MNPRETMVTMHACSKSMALAVISLATAVFSPAVTAEVVHAVEYYHQAFEHYFVTADPTEIAALDSGAVSGWWRTGQRYRVDTAPGEGLLPVCRFYTSAYAGKASHFYTASVSECAHVKTMPDWTYEGVAFFARVPDVDGRCAAGTAPINRLFNNGQGGAPNHAYTTHIAKRDAMVLAGWAAEGVAYCTPLSTADPLAQMKALAGSTWNLPSPPRFSTPSVDWGTYRTVFSPLGARSSDAAYAFSYYGLPVPPSPIWMLGESPSFNDWGGGGGGAAWDALSDAYVLVMYGGYHEPAPYEAMAWIFDSAEGPVTPVCVMALFENRVPEPLFLPPYRPHSFQPYLCSGCEQGVANRL